MNVEGPEQGRKEAAALTEAAPHRSRQGAGEAAQGEYQAGYKYNIRDVTGQ